MKTYIVVTEIRPDVWKQVRVTENLEVAKAIAKRNHENNYPTLVEDENGGLIFDPSLNIFEKAKMKQSDTVRDNMLITMIENAINDATKTRANKDYSRVNGYLGYAQGVIETALKVKAITALRAKQYKAEIKRIVMQ